MLFSASRIKTWMACPLQAHYHYDERLPRRMSGAAAFGTCIHHALQLYNDTGSADLARSTFVDVWDNPEKLGVTPDYYAPFTNWSSYLSTGIAIIEDFHLRASKDKRVVVATEIGFKVPFGDHELTGYIDLLETRRSGRGKELLRVVDLKSGSKAPTKAALSLDVQFTVYMWAVNQREFWVGHNSDPEFPGLPNGEWLWETAKDLPRRAIWYHLRNQREIDAGPRGDVDFQRLYRVCEQIERAAEARVFVPRIGEACGLCDYVEQCAMDIPDSFGVQKNDPDAWI